MYAETIETAKQFAVAKVSQTQAQLKTALNTARTLTNIFASIKDNNESRASQRVLLTLCQRRAEMDRILTYVDSDFKDVMAVLKKMIQQKH